MAGGACAGDPMAPVVEVREALQQLSAGLGCVAVGVEVLVVGGKIVCGPPSEVQPSVPESRDQLLPKAVGWRLAIDCSDFGMRRSTAHDPAQTSPNTVLPPEKTSSLAICMIALRSSYTRWSGTLRPFLRLPSPCWLNLQVAMAI